MKILFQYTVLLHTYDEKGAYKDSEMVIPPIFRLAKSEKDLLFAITREIPDKYVEIPDNIQIIIRNF
jgi:hypothetical protein